jgi:hypothetical protein
MLSWIPKQMRGPAPNGTYACLDFQFKIEDPEVMADATADVRAGEGRIWTGTAGFLTRSRVARDGSDDRESVR